jgi:mono/diheme cytochrome c family protein
MVRDIHRLCRQASRRRFGLLLLLNGSLLACPVVGAQHAGAGDALDPGQVERGQHVYREFCAQCHGASLEGQADWRIRKPDGRLPAPPHDQTGHTWHHPDEVLFWITKHGLVSPYAPEDYQSNMPAFGGTLSDDDILAVIAYIKSRWPVEVRKIQEDINAQSQRRAR